MEEKYHWCKNCEEAGHPSLGCTTENTQGKTLITRCKKCILEGNNGVCDVHSCKGYVCEPMKAHISAVLDHFFIIENDLRGSHYMNVPKDRLIETIINIRRTLNKIYTPEA